MLALNKEIMVDTALFRSLSARITTALIFLVIVLMMLNKQLPYQLPPSVSNTPVTKLNHQIIAILSTCSLILFFFIPTKKMALFATISMFCLFLSYSATEATYIQNWMFCIPLLPFCMKDEKMYTQLRYQKWIVPFMLLLAILQYNTNVFSAVSTILYILPYLPFYAITKWVANQLEPR
jgi:hypothetical protein